MTHYTSLHPVALQACGVAVTRRGSSLQHFSPDVSRCDANVSEAGLRVPWGEREGTQVHGILGSTLKQAPTGVEAESRQPSPLGPQQIPGILEPQPTRSLERGFLLAGHLPPALTAHVVHGPVEMLDDVESVEHDQSLWEIHPHCFQIRRPHVA